MKKLTLVSSNLLEEIVVKIFLKHLALVLLMSKFMMLLDQKVQGSPNRPSERIYTTVKRTQ